MQESFLSLEQQTSTFQAHLEGLGKENQEGLAGPLAQVNGADSCPVSPENSPHLHSQRTSDLSLERRNSTSASTSSADADPETETDNPLTLCERSALQFSTTMGRLRKSGRKKWLLLDCGDFVNIKMSERESLLANVDHLLAAFHFKDCGGLKQTPCVLQTQGGTLSPVITKTPHSPHSTVLFYQIFYILYSCLRSVSAVMDHGPDLHMWLINDSNSKKKKNLIMCRMNEI